MYNQTDEQNVLAQCQDSINKIRKGNLSIVIKNQLNRVVSNASVKISQKKHDFLFGANINFSDTNTRTLYSQLFNYGTISEFIWRIYEPIQNNTTSSDSYIANLISWCKSNNITIKGHPLLWGFDFLYPTWTNGVKPTDDQNTKHVTDIINKYKSDIKIWDVINENGHYKNIDNAKYYNLVKTLQSDCVSISNDFGMFQDDYNPEIYTYYQNLFNIGTKIDIMGLQAHQSNADDAYPINKVYDTLNCYASLGKPLYITEMSVPSDNNPVGLSTWRGTWNETTQANYLVDFYTLCFAHPNVNSISTWDFVDAADEANCWRKDIGLIRSDGTPKEAYNKLKNLITSVWNTSATLTTNLSGGVNTSAYYGTYDIDVTYKSKTTKFTGKLFNKTNNGQITLKITV